MTIKTFSVFMTEILAAAQEFALANEGKLTFEADDHMRVNYIQGESTPQEGRIYTIWSETKGNYAISFASNPDNKYTVYIESEGVSLTLNQDLNRITEYDNTDFCRAVDNIQGDQHEKFIKLLSFISDYGFSMHTMIEVLKRMK